MSENDQEEWPPQLDAVIAAAKNHRVLMEDDAVRVLKSQSIQASARTFTTIAGRASWSFSLDRTMSTAMRRET